MAKSLTTTLGYRELLSSNHTELIKKLLTLQETGTLSLLSSSLSDMIKRDLIKVKDTHLVLVMSENLNGVEIRQAVDLELADKEYIEKLEKEVEELRSFIKNKWK